MDVATRSSEAPAWVAWSAATVLAAVGVFLLVAQLDPFLVLAVLPLVAVLTLIGAHARRHADVPPRWWYWVATAFVAGLLIYGAAYWVYGLTHAPMAS